MLLLLLIPLFVVGQINLWSSSYELTDYFDQIDAVYDIGFQDNGGIYYTNITNEELYIRYFFDESNLFVDFIILIPFTDRAFINIDDYCNDYNRSFDGGSILMDTRKLLDFDYPVFVFTWTLD